MKDFTDKCVIKGCDRAPIRTMQMSIDLAQHVRVDEVVLDSARYHLVEVGVCGIHSALLGGPEAPA